MIICTKMEQVRLVTTWTDVLIKLPRDDPLSCATVLGWPLSERSGFVFVFLFNVTILHQWKVCVNQCFVTISPSIAPLSPATSVCDSIARVGRTKFPKEELLSSIWAPSQSTAFCSFISLVRPNTKARNEWGSGKSCAYLWFLFRLLQKL